MGDDEAPVAREPQVQLEEVDARAHGVGEGGERVLGAPRPGAPV
ncbi:MAG: hypothetical protein FD126_3502, partial [Elusimicrobia bacterium]